ncbi:MAG TPA: vitamin K epoxide reductase family protein [Microbacteriaceae bacterium]|nr:vitamin K epoxide reductase family protein [Microbacteriaceae bacterium]
MTDVDVDRTDNVDDVAPRSRALAVWLVVGGAIGLLAAFMLTWESILYWKDPSQGAACDLSPLVNCSQNLSSAYGSLFGFPNPLIGMMAWPVVITTGVLMLAGVTLPKWYWRGLAFGTILALLLVSGFVSISIYILHVLCPWCMLTWSVVIPTFWGVTLFTLKEGILVGPSRSSVAAKLFGWVPTLSFACYLVIVLLAQLQLDAIPRILQSWGL